MNKPHTKILLNIVKIILLCILFMNTACESEELLYVNAYGDTFVFNHPDFIPNQTGTFMVGKEDLQRVAFQTPKYNIFNLLLSFIGVDEESGTCQIATTVTRIGLSQYDKVAHGEECATVTIDPPLTKEHGPFYFNSDTIPDNNLQETSPDGGVAFTNVPPGTYILRAHKEGVLFKDVKIKCRAGYLVNAAPPNGLQVIAK